MPTETLLDSDMAVAALLLFPPEVRAAILKDAEFRERMALGVDAVITVERTGAKFARSMLFEAVRRVFGGADQAVDIEAEDGTIWHVTHDSAKGITVGREDVADSFPDFVCMAPDGNRRIEWFERKMTACSIGNERTIKWREALAARPLDDEELDELLDECRLTPMHWTMVVRKQLREPTARAADLVPSDVRYFDRLAGEPSAKTDTREFVSSVLTPHVRTLVQWNPYEGLRTAFLLSSHQTVSEVVDLTTARRADVLRVFQWLTDHGDRISQIGAIECGLRHLDLFPEIEPYLAVMARVISADDPEDSGGRLKLLSSLVALVEGEVIRQRIARWRPPFWRRLASIAHAALIEREVLDAKLEVESLADWALNSDLPPVVVPVLMRELGS